MMSSWKVLRRWEAFSNGWLALGILAGDGGRCGGDSVAALRTR